MVIQSNMKVLDITNTWAETKQVFKQYGISVDTTKQIKEIVPEDVVELILKDLNMKVGSSDITCVEGG